LKPDDRPARDTPPPHERMFEVPPGAHEPLADLAATAGARIEEELHQQRQLERRWSAYLFLALAIVAGVTGTSALSASAGFTRWQPLVVVALAYLVCFVALTRALQVIPVSIAYAVWSGVGIALVTLIGWLVFGQTLGVGELAGIALILVGTVVIQLFSRSTFQ
jgi:small multidrug resistance pump